MCINIENTIFKIFKTHIYPRKFCLMNLNVLCPKWDFEQLNEKPNKLMMTKYNINDEDKIISHNMLQNQLNTEFP